MGAGCLSYIVLTAVLSIAGIAAAGEPSCTFNAVEHEGDYSFSVSSRPDGECGRQSLSIAVQKSARLTAQYEKSTDMLVRRAWVSDLDDDARPELVLVAQSPANPARVSLSVFAMDGAGIREIALPDPPDREGYRGGDQFSRDGGRIVRSYRLYRATDRDGTPTGEKRVVSYRYRDRQLLPVANRDFPAGEAATTKLTKSVRVKGKGERTPAVRVTGIAVKPDYLEILADGAIEKYTVTRISDPWRLIIDIAGATSAVPANTVAINRLGISTARIGAHKGHLRIVLDSAENMLPTETVIPAEHSLRIGFYRER